MNKKKSAIILIVIILLLIAIPVLCQVFILNQNGNSLLPEKEKLHEADYVHAYCNGTEEYVLPDKTRVDCLTETHACEFDWAKKWYEGFGQALWYAHNTGKKPCLVLILKSQNLKNLLHRNFLKKQENRSENKVKCMFTKIIPLWLHTLTNLLYPYFTILH